MLNKLEITFEGDHILVVADGDKDYRYMDRLRDPPLLARYRLEFSGGYKYPLSAGS